MQMQVAVLLLVGMPGDTLGHEGVPRTRVLYMATTHLETNQEGFL